MRYGRIRNRRRRGFTLVELLMVMMIIAILAALLMSGVQSAWVSVGRARVLSELSQLETALNSYKSDKGEFPPSLAGPQFGALATVNVTTRSNQLMSHLSRAFPRFINRANFINTATSAEFPVRNLGGTPSAPTYATKNLNLKNLDPAESYLFFLNGLPILQNNVPQGFDGFNADPVNPLVPPPNPTSSSQTGRTRTRPLFDVDPKRLVDKDGDGFPEYLPADKSAAPIVYFVSGQYASSATLPETFPAISTDQTGQGSYAANWGYAAPYANRKPTAVADADAWKNPQGIQLIAAGTDGKYGPATPPTAFRLIPSSLSKEEGDNLTNFHSSNLGSAK